MAIVGNGNIAKVLTDRHDVLFFASGTSDSSTTDAAVFQREIDLLMTQDKSMHIVYFSSLGIYRFNNAYLSHKRHMESLIKSLFDSYTIVRIEVIEWGKNPKTIINDMKRKLSEGRVYNVRNEYRHVISLYEFRYWLSMIPVGEKNEMNLPGKMMTVREIFEKVKNGEF